MVSSVSNFHLDTGGRRWSLVQVRLCSRAVGREGHCRQISLACVGSTCSVLATLGLPLLRADMCALPVYTAQAPTCSIWSGPCVACGSSFRVFHKSADSVGPVFCAFPDPSSSGHQELEERTLPGCGTPSPLHGPSLSFSADQLGACALCLFSGAGLWPRPSWRMSTIHNLRKSLVRNWEPVCSLVGGAISGAEFAPFPSPLPPASGGGWLFSGIAQSLCSANGWQCVLAVCLAG